MAAENKTIIAVDIGNARMKIGAFNAILDNASPEPKKTISIDGESPEFECLSSWLEELSDQYAKGAIPFSLTRKSSQSLFSWNIASVNRHGATRLINWLSEHRPDDRVTLLSADDLPLEVGLEHPDMVGIDRLVDAVAVNRLRDPVLPAVIVDVGTAITVDMVSADGVFLGGAAILPGLAMSARAMHEFTDLLPLVEVLKFSDPPSALGVSTESAMQSGLFWGTVGAIRQLIEQLGRETVTIPQIFLTGGAATTVAQLLGPDAKFIPHLTLSGIVLSILENDN